MKTHTNAIGPAEKKFCPKCGLLHERDCTNTNDTALIEAIENLPDHPMAYLVLQAPLHELDAGFRVDSLKSLVSRLREAEKERDEFREMCGAADQVRALDQVSVKWLLERFGEDWFAYSKNPTTRHPDALSAYKSLKGESNDG